MPMRLKLTSILLVLSVALPEITAGELPAHFQGLLERPPFGRRSANLESDKAKPAEIEFRAASQEGGHWFFSIFEVTEKRSSWQGLNQPKADILIKSFDTENLVISVEYRGITHTLALKGSKPFPATTITRPAPTIQPPAEDETYHDHPFRIGHVAEELEVREAVRRGE